MERVPEPVVVTLSTWLDVHDEIAPGVIEGLYVVGSVALDDWTPRSDIDVVAVVADASDPDLADQLGRVQEEFGHRSSIVVDGPYVAWGDLVVPPANLHRPWVLDGEYRVDAECGEISPVVWYTLATYGITVRGETPDRIGIALDIDERRMYVRENVLTYWRGVGQRLADALAADTQAETTDGEVLEWVALGVARMLYTWETGDVTSKSGAGRWAAANVPRFAECLLAAVSLRATPGQTTRAHLDDAVALVDLAVHRVTTEA